MAQAYCLLFRPPRRAEGKASAAKPILYPLQKPRAVKRLLFFFVSRGFAQSVAAWPTHLRDPEFGALRSSVSEEDIGQYTNKFAIANIYLVGHSGHPKFLVAWSAQACCDRSNPSKGRKRGACLYILCIIYRYFLPITAKYNYICVGIGVKLCR